MNMTRRFFLKGVTALAASGAVMLNPVVTAYTGTEPLVSPVLTGASDIVFGNTEVIWSDIHTAHMYRGTAHLRGDPENMKYFSSMVDDPDIIATEDFTKELYGELLQAFNGGAA